MILLLMNVLAFVSSFGIKTSSLPVLAKNNLFAASMIKLCSEIGYKANPKMIMITSRTPPRSPKRSKIPYFYLLCFIPVCPRIRTVLYMTRGLSIEVSKSILL